MNINIFCKQVVFDKISEIYKNENQISHYRFWQSPFEQNIHVKSYIDETRYPSAKPSADEVSIYSYLPKQGSRPLELKQRICKQMIE